MGAPVAPDALLHMSLAIQEIMDAQAELLMQPTYPKWYRPEDYPRPRAEAMLAKARALESEFAPLRARILDEIQLARMDKAGVPRDFDKNEDDPWVDTSISGEIELIAYQLADSVLTFDATPRHRDEEDEAAKKVDFARAALDHARALHAAAGNGNLELEKARTLLTTGRLAWHCTLNLDADADELPFIEHLVDPTSCYPIFEAHKGLRVMVRSYQTTVGEAVAAFDTVDNALYQKIVLDVMAKQPDRHKRREEEACEVVEYWDRRWRAVFIDGDLIRAPMEHAYGFVPFVYKLSALGMPAYLRDPAGGDRDGYRNDTLLRSLSNRDVAMPYKGMGLPSLLKKPTAQREAVYTTMMKAFSVSVEPPIVVEADDIVAPQGVPTISRLKGDASLIKMGHHKVQEIPTNPNGGVMMPILQAVADNGARLTLPPTVHGLNDHSNVSGYATQGLNEAGRIKLVPWQRTLEDFERECMELRFRIFRDWGWLVGDATGEGEVGTIMVPRQDAPPGEEQMVALSPGDLKRAGIKITASMSTLPLQMLGPVANAVGLLMQMGIEDEIGAMKLLNVANPYKKLERIRMNKFYNDPDYLEAKGLKQLAERDPELAAYFMLKKMTAAQAEAQAPPPGQPPMGVMGDSQAAMGQGPGPGSGPQGPLAPPDPFGVEP
jgi:hypothetical protein